MLTNPKALSAYGPDGGYPEGFHYWGYGTSFQVLLIAVLESALGTDAGLSEYPGFLESARFMEFMTAPSGEYFNFSDAVNGVRCNMMMFWFAKKMGGFIFAMVRKSIFRESFSLFCRRSFIALSVDFLCSSGFE